MSVCVYVCNHHYPSFHFSFPVLHRKAFSSLYPEVEKNRALKKSRKEITSVFQKGGGEEGRMRRRKECEKYERVRSMERERESL